MVLECPLCIGDGVLEDDVYARYQRDTDRGLAAAALALLQDIEPLLLELYLSSDGTMDPEAVAVMGRRIRAILEARS